MVVLLSVSFVFPVKFCLRSYPDGDAPFCVVRYDGMKNWWILAGDETGLYDWNTVSDQPVGIVGKNFEDVISGDLYLWDMPTYFVLWGDVTVKEEYDDNHNVVSRQYTVDCTDWDVLERVHSRNEFRMNFSSRYLTVYDYKWFDEFRKVFWYYDES